MCLIVAFHMLVWRVGRGGAGSQVKEHYHHHCSEICYVLEHRVITGMSWCHISSRGMRFSPAGRHVKGVGVGWFVFSRRSIKKPARLGRVICCAAASVTCAGRCNVAELFYYIHIYTHLLTGNIGIYKLVRLYQSSNHK